MNARTKRKVSDPISVRLRSARWFFVEMRMFYALLDAILLFIASSTVLVFIEADITYAFVPPAIYVFIMLVRALLQSQPIRTITRKHPYFDCRLQTAYDNRQKPNLISDRLIGSVSARLDDLGKSTFLNGKTVLLKVLLITALLYVFLSINYIHLKDASARLQEDLTGRLEDLDLRFGGGAGQETFSMMPEDSEKSQFSTKDEDDKIGSGSGGKVPGYNEGPLPGEGSGVGEEKNREIYGEPTSVQVEGHNIKAEIHPEYGGQIEITDSEAGEEQETTSRIPENIESTSTPEQEPVEYEEMIRKYFEKLSVEDMENG